MLNSQQISDLVESLKSTAKKNFMESGNLTPVVLILAARDPKTGVALAEPAVVIMPLSFENQSQKDIAAKDVRAVVRRTNPLLVVQIMESWMAKAPPGSKEFEEIHKAASAGKLCESPQRIEIIRVSAESDLLPDGGAEYISEIFREGLPEDPPILGEWTAYPLADQGRFSRLLDN